jgi:hypothetical protein
MAIASQRTNRGLLYGAVVASEVIPIHRNAELNSL